MRKRKTITIRVRADEATAYTSWSTSFLNVTQRNPEGRKNIAEIRIETPFDLMLIRSELQRIEDSWTSALKQLKDEKQ